MADQLTEQEIALLKETFDIFDLDNNGQITPTELRLVLSSLWGAEATEDEVQSVIKAVDADQDGTINREEFINAIAPYMKALDLSDLELRKIFHLFDLDGDGFIEAAEMRQAMARLADEVPTKEAVDEMMQEADTDGDGKVSFEEFVQAIRREGKPF